MWGESQGKGWADATSRPPPQPSERVPHQAAPNTRLQCPRPGSSRWLPSSATEPDATATGGLSNNQITKYQLSPVRSMLIQLPWAVRTSSHPTAGLIKKTEEAQPQMLLAPCHGCRKNKISLHFPLGGTSRVPAMGPHPCPKPPSAPCSGVPRPHRWGLTAPTGAELCPQAAPTTQVLQLLASLRCLLVIFY